MLNIKNGYGIKELLPLHIWKIIDAKESIQIYATDDGYAWIDFEKMPMNSYIRKPNKQMIVDSIVEHITKKPSNK